MILNDIFTESVIGFETKKNKKKREQLDALRNVDHKENMKKLSDKIRLAKVDSRRSNFKIVK